MPKELKTPGVLNVAIFKNVLCVKKLSVRLFSCEYKLALKVFKCYIW